METSHHDSLVASTAESHEELCHVQSMPHPWQGKADGRFPVAFVYAKMTGRIQGNPKRRRAPFRLAKQMNLIRYLHKQPERRHPTCKKESKRKQLRFFFLKGDVSDHSNSNAV